MDKFYIEDAAGGFGFFPYNTINDYDQWSQEFRLSGEAERSALDTGRVLPRHDLGHVSVGRRRADPRRHQRHAEDVDVWRSRFTQLVGLRAGRVRPHRAMDGGRGAPLVAGRQGPGYAAGLRGRARGSTAGRAVQHRRRRDPEIDTIDYGDYAARLQLNFKPVDGTLLYGSINRGIKGGNWSLDPLGGVPMRTCSMTKKC